MNRRKRAEDLLDEVHRGPIVARLARGGRRLALAISPYRVSPVGAQNRDPSRVFSRRRLATLIGRPWTPPKNAAAVRHSVANRSNIDRVHLVIDGLVSDWVSGLFEQARVG